VGSKAIAIVLVMLVGAVAAYDIQLLQNRRSRSAPQPSAAQAAVDEIPAEAATGENDVAAVSESAAENAEAELVAGLEDVSEDAVTAEGTDVATATEVPGPPQQVEPPVIEPVAGIAEAAHPAAGAQEISDDVSRKLPAVFEMKWENPFGTQSAAGVQQQPAVQATSPTAVWQNPFAGRQVVVSAVLICGSKRAIVDGRIVREGDRLAGGAEVAAITASGVELKLGEETQFVAVSNSGTSDNEE